MKLGIKTTDGVAKLKTKNTDGVVKAVECACCICNDDGPWGPGYDTQPDTVSVTAGDTVTLIRVNKCMWQIYQFVYWQNYEDWPSYEYSADSNYKPKDPYANVYSAYISPWGFYGYNRGVEQVLYADLQGLKFDGDYIMYYRVGGEHPFPYGIYEVIPEALNQEGYPSLDLGPIIVSP